MYKKSTADFLRCFLVSETRDLKIRKMFLFYLLGFTDSTGIGPFWGLEKCYLATTSFLRADLRSLFCISTIYIPSTRLEISTSLLSAEIVWVWIFFPVMSAI